MVILLVCAHYLLKINVEVHKVMYYLLKRHKFASSDIIHFRLNKQAWKSTLKIKYKKKTIHLNFEKLKNKLKIHKMILLNRANKALCT